MDKNKDGVLCKEELMQGYNKIHGAMAEVEVEKLFAQIDTDGSGKIDFSEWVVYATDKSKLLKDEQKLHAAFRYFDKDGNGTITPDEVKDLFCGSMGKVNEKVNGARSRSEVAAKASDDQSGSLETEPAPAVAEDAVD